MKKLTVLATIPLLAGFAWAQENQTQTTKTTTTTTTTHQSWNGQLVDASCHRTEVAHRETTETTHPDENTTKTTRTTTNTSKVECPVSTTTTEFGLLTPSGQYVTFDQQGNTRVIEALKNNQRWSREVSNNQPVKVRVMGTANGDVITVESIK